MAAKVIDSTGKTVGTLVTPFFSETSALVEFTINHKKYFMTVTVDAIGGGQDILLYHTDPDCAGPNYIPYDNNVYFFPYPKYYLTPLGWISNRPDGVTPQNLTTVSTGETSSPACREEIITHDVITIEQATGPDFRAGFTPPFRLEL